MEDPGNMEAAPESACAEPVPAGPPAWVRVAQSFTGPWTWRNLFSWVGLIGAVFTVKGCFVDQYTIPSGSMETTLRGNPRFFRGDRVIVNKWIFGPRIPFTKYRLWEGEKPARWDIVVFKAVTADAKHPVLIKRVVGLPGEKVQIRKGSIYIDGKREDPPPDLQKVLHYTTEFTLSQIQIRRYFLELAKENRPLAVFNAEHPSTKLLYSEMARFHDAVKHRDIEGLTDDEVQELVHGVSLNALSTVRKLVELDMPPMVYGIDDTLEHTVVPEGHYFCLGDNSGQSLDGRVYGWVPKENLIGRAAGIWWPISRRRDFTGFTRTWQGKLLMYGPLAALAGLEMAARLRRGARKRAAAAEGPIQQR